MTVRTGAALGYFALMSIAAFIAYGMDKRRAKRGAWRISERTLLLLSLLGGAAGALLAMQTFRHKTKHWYFYAAGAAGLVWQAALVICLFFAEGGMLV